MGLSTVAVMLAAIVVGGASVGGAGSGSVADITCNDDGTSTLRDPVVDASSDGVHVRVDNELTEEVFLNGLGVQGVNPGISDVVAHAAPGLVYASCWSHRHHQGRSEPAGVPLVIRDEAGYWIDYNCEATEGWINDFGDPGDQELPAQTEAELEEKARADWHAAVGDEVFERAGYPDQAEPVYRVLRQGRVVGSIRMTRLGGRLVVSSGSRCAE